MGVPKLAKKRPAETGSAVSGTVVGAVFILLGAYGVKVPPEVPGAALVVISAVAGLITQLVDRGRENGS